MIFRSGFLACIYLLLPSSILHAREEPISNAVCKNIVGQKSPSAFLFHKGQLWDKNQSISLGELESQPNKNGILSSGESYLILTPAKYTAAASTSNTLKVDLTEVPALCNKTKQYKIKWNVYPKNFGPGKFEEQFSLDFDGPGNYGYPPPVNMMFQASVTGVIHGPGSTIDINKGAAQEFFLGKNSSLRFFVRNVGDRSLKLNNLASDIPENAKEIRLKHTDCLKKTIEPASSCVIELESHSRLPKSSKVISYTLAFTSNEVGSSSTEIHLEYDEKLGLHTYIKRWE